MGKMQGSKEFSTLKDKPMKEGKYESKLKFAGWDIAYVTDDSEGLDFTCFSKTASESDIKKRFKDIRSELIECLKLDPEAADNDDANSFSIMYFPDNAEPGNSKTLTFALYFYPKDKKTDSFISISIQASKD